MSETMSTTWGRGVYVNGELSTWGTTPIAAMGHQVHAHIVDAYRAGGIPADWDLTTAAHDGPMLVIRFRGTGALINDSKMRKIVVDHVRRQMGYRAAVNRIDAVQYVGMIVFVDGETNQVIEGYNHMI